MKEENLNLSNSTPLKPCQCGGTPVFWDWTDDGEIAIVCKKCSLELRKGAGCVNFDKYKEALFEVWNNRPLEDALLNESKALKDRIVELQAKCDKYEAFVKKVRDAEGWFSGGSDTYVVDGLIRYEAHSLLESEDGK